MWYSKFQWNIGNYIILNGVISTYFKFYSLGCCQELPLPTRIIFIYLQCQKSCFWRKLTNLEKKRERMEMEIPCRNTFVNRRQFQWTWNVLGSGLGWVVERRVIKGNKIRKSPQADCWNSLPLELLQRARRGTDQQRTKRKKMHLVNILLFQARFFHYFKPDFFIISSRFLLYRSHSLTRLSIIRF